MQINLCKADIFNVKKNRFFVVIYTCKLYFYIILKKIIFLYLFYNSSNLKSMPAFIITAFLVVKHFILIPYCIS